MIVVMSLLGWPLASWRAGLRVPEKRAKIAKLFRKCESCISMRLCVLPGG